MTEQYTWQKTNIADEVLSKRTAATVAGFFTPYLQPGMRLLDCGCGPGTITVDLAALVAPGETIGIDQDATTNLEKQRKPNHEPLSRRNATRASGLCRVCEKPQ